MNREIKFRAIYKPQFGEGGMFEVTSIDWNDGLVEGEIPLHAVELMQYTGLKDKNGKEIYEGDLLQKYDALKPRVVKWTDQNGAYFVLSNSATNKVDWDDCLTAGRIETYGYEVIGNIWEHPNLLESK